MIALVAGIFDDETDVVDMLSKKIKNYRKNTFIINTEIYMGCIITHYLFHSQSFLPLLLILHDQPLVLVVRFYVPYIQVLHK